MSERLIGNWRLISYETTETGGRRGKPYGDAIGRLMYDDRGNMAGQVMRPDRARVELGASTGLTPAEPSTSLI